MTDIGEKVAVNTLIEEDEAQEEQVRDPIKIRFSVFFDGTLNNRDNIAARQLASSGKRNLSTKEQEMVDAYKKHGKEVTIY